MDTSIHRFPRDFAEVSQTAYSVAMHLAITNYPDIYKDEKAIEAIAQANLTKTLKEIKTNDLQAFKAAFLYSFCSGYRDAGKYCEETPENYKIMMSLTSDEQIPLCKTLACTWYTFIDKELLPRMRVKPRLAKRRRRK